MDAGTGAPDVVGLYSVLRTQLKPRIINVCCLHMRKSQQVEDLSVQRKADTSSFQSCSAHRRQSTFIGSPMDSAENLPAGFLYTHWSGVLNAVGLSGVAQAHCHAPSRDLTRVFHECQIKRRNSDQATADPLMDCQCTPKQIDLDYSSIILIRAAPPFVS